MAETSGDRLEFLQGTLELLILRTLRFGPLHGYGVAQFIGESSGGALTVEAGSLYPALQRLELQGLITAKWDISDRNRRARYYRLTPAGRRRLVADESRWRQFVAAVGRVLDPIPQE
jgi:PadR family transcriptional regulator PadR